jgi:hypothetical protein
MIARVLFVWFSFAAALLLLGLFSQGEPFELQQIGLSLGLSLPLALCVLRGGLGELSSGQLRYPSLTLMVVAAWTLVVGPSLVVESHAARYLYHYSEAGLMLARLFFFSWCLIFVVATGKPRLTSVTAHPSTVDFAAWLAVAALIASYMVRAGIFSFYASSRYRVAPEAGSTESIATVLGLPLFIVLPPLLFLTLMRTKASLARFVAVLMGFLASWALLFLLGSRTAVAVAVASCLLLCRGFGLRLRANVLLTLSVVMPAMLMLIFVYRTALSSADEDVTSTVGQYISIASDATTSLNEDEAQSEAIDLFSDNMRVRLWYGQQFSALVDEWLDHGAAMRGSMFSGVILSLPTFFMSKKNDYAVEVNFERLMIATQRFPDVDLAPMPWMQWLYELGILGLVIGALMYAWLARTIESRISKTTSFYEVAFWLQIFAVMLPPEHTSDALVFTARSSLVVVLLVGVLARSVSWFLNLGRRTSLT